MVGSSVTSHASSSFGRFSLGDVCGTVVRDGRSHQHEVGVATGERLLEHRLSGGSLDDFDAGRRGHAQVRGEEGHLGAALASLLGQGDAHAAG